jgi:hypothetical protein
MIINHPSISTVKVNAYDKPFNYLLASLFWNPETMWIEAPVKVQKKELSCVQVRIKLCRATAVPTMSRQTTRINHGNNKMAIAYGLA